MSETEQNKTLLILGQEMGVYEDLQEIAVECLAYSGVEFNDNYKVIFNAIHPNSNGKYDLSFDFFEGFVTFYDDEGDVSCTYKLELDEADVWLLCEDHNVDADEEEKNKQADLGFASDDGDDDAQQEVCSDDGQ